MGSREDYAAAIITLLYLASGAISRKALRAPSNKKTFMPTIPIFGASAVVMCTATPSCSENFAPGLQFDKFSFLFAACLGRS